MCKRSYKYSYLYVFWWFAAASFWYLSLRCCEARHAGHDFRPSWWRGQRVELRGPTRVDDTVEWEIHLLAMIGDNSQRWGLIIKLIMVMMRDNHGHDSHNNNIIGDNNSYWVKTMIIGLDSDGGSSIVHNPHYLVVNRRLWATDGGEQLP